VLGRGDRRYLLVQYARTVRALVLVERDKD